MARFRLTALFAALLCLPALATETEPPPDPDLGTDIVSAAASEGQLWVLGAPKKAGNVGGALVSFSLADGARQVRLASGVIGLKKIGSRLVVLSADSDKKASLREFRNGEFVSLPPLPPDVNPSSILAVGNDVGALTTHTLFVLAGTTWRGTRLDDDKPPPPGAFSLGAFGPFDETAGVNASGTSAYFGINRGEWGGALNRIDLTTRQASSIQNKSSAPDGEAVYDSALDPVNAIISDPANRDCVIVAVGLIHFAATGRLLRVCGDAASIVLDKFTPKSGQSGPVYGSEAFFGLVPANDGYWAVSDAAVYRFGLSAEPQRFVLSHFALWHGLWVSREAPGALVLITESNRRFSVNNGTPLIVPLD